MPISKIKGGAINDDAISTAKIVDDAVTSPKIVDSYTTALQTNPEFSGTEAARMPNGTTAQRANAATGDLRFNTTLSLMEYYDGSQWKSIDSPPVISSLSPDNFDTAGDTITISGSNFQSGATVKIVAADNQELIASSVTFTNSSTVSFDVTSAMVADDNDPYDVVITNPSGLAGTLADGLDFAPEPAFTKAAGSLGSIYNNSRGSVSITTGATSTESDATVTYAVTTGSLPSGLSISSSTGTITGSTSAVGSDTTTSFSITATATDGSSNTTTNVRAYSIIQKAPVISSYTSTGSGTFAVPTGVSLMDVLVVAGGGSGGSGQYSCGGGGGGGLIYRPAFPVTPGGSVSYTVGSGGGGAYNDGSYSQLHDNVRDFPQRGQEGTNAAKIGQDSVFGTLTARGGGRGGSYAPSQSGHTHTDGGSGGGAPASTDQTAFAAGNTKTSDKIHAGIQSQQPGESGQYGFGNPGGYVGQSDPFSPNYYGGGGGGAGGAGSTSNGQSGPAGNGGVGKQYAISGSQVYYAGGGAGGKHGTSPSGTAVGQGGNGGGGQGFGQVGATVNPNANGTANRGGGAGGVGYTGGQASRGGTGGSGIVIVKY